MEAEIPFQLGERSIHNEFGHGVVLDPARDGYLRAANGRADHTQCVAVRRASCASGNGKRVGADFGQGRSAGLWCK